jgi:hypothetical protein
MSGKLYMIGPPVPPGERRAILVHIKGKYEGKTYTAHAVVSDLLMESTDDPLLKEVKLTLAEHLGDNLGVPRALQDDDWRDRFDLYFQPLTEAQWERYIAEGDE